MKLINIVEMIDQLDDDLCIVAKPPWNANSDALAICLDENYAVPQNILQKGYQYFLEIHVARDDVLSAFPKLTIEHRIRALIFYAENDAYPDWVNYE